MSAIAYLFILTSYLEAKDFWSDVGEEPESDQAVATEIDRTFVLICHATFPEKIDDST